jgi:lysophospholipase L1-like esterase
MRKYVNDAKAAGAIPIVCSPIPRNMWKDGKVIRSNEAYALWAKEVAQQTNAYFIDLNNSIGDAYEKMGKQKTAAFFPGDHTHTNREGALFNANIVINGIKNLKGCTLKNYLLNQ